MTEQTGTVPQESSEQTNPHMAWGWSLTLGTILTIMGFAALSTPILTNAAAVAVIGWMGWFLLFAGIAQLIAAFVNRDEESLAMNAMLAVVYFIFGIILVNNTNAENAVTLTLFMAIFFLIDGIFKVVLSFQMRGQRNWGWLLAGSIISILFAFLIFSNFFVSSISLVGIMVSIQIIFMGIGMIFDGFEGRKTLQLESGKSAKMNPLLIIAVTAILTVAFIRFF